MASPFMKMEQHYRIKEIRIIAASNSIGGGHSQRMHNLQEILREHLPFPSDIHLLLYDTGKPVENPAEWVEQSLYSYLGWKYVQRTALYILDARDIDPYSFLQKGPLLLIDNRHVSRPLLEYREKKRAQERAEERATERATERAERQNAEQPYKVCFYDTLPHPEVDMETVLRQALISPELIRLRKEQPRQQSGNMDAPARRRQALVYTGSLETAFDLRSLLIDLLQKKQLDRAIWIGAMILGGHRPIKPIIEELVITSPYCFLETMNASDMVFTYSGMSLLESWYLGVEAILIEMQSEEHNRLGDWLAQQTNITFLKQGQEDPWRHHLQGASRRAIKAPGSEGYNLLLKKIKTLLND